MCDFAHVARSIRRQSIQASEMSEKHIVSDNVALQRSIKTNFDGFANSDIYREIDEYRQTTIDHFINTYL